MLFFQYFRFGRQLVTKDGTLAASVLGIIAVATSAVAVGRLSRDGLFSGMYDRGGDCIWCTG